MVKSEIGKTEDGNSPFLADMIVDFVEHIEVELGRSIKTAENYNLYMERLVEFVGNIPIIEINSELVRKYRLWLNRYTDSQGKELSIMTQNYHLIALRGFLKYCGGRDIATLDASKVALPKVKKKQVSFLSFDEVSRLIDAVDIKNPQGLRDRAILALLFSGGMRVSELCNLNRDQINLQRLEFTVRGKGGKDRPIFISSVAGKITAEYLETRTDSAIPLFINESRNVAMNESGEKTTGNKGEALRLSPRSVQRIIKHYSRLAGITKKVTPHTLRHSFATDMLMNGADIRSIQSLLGHSNIATTQVYTHITDPHLKEVHQRFHRDPEQNI